MTINPLVRYPTQVAAATPGYPYGSARNVTISGDGTGTPWEFAVLNDFWGLVYEILDRAGLTPNNTPDQVGASQFVEALLESGIIGDDAISDVSISKFTTGTTNITLGNYNLIMSQNYIKFTNTTDGSVLDLRAGVGSGEPSIIYTSGDSGRVIEFESAGSKVTKAAGASYQLATQNTGAGHSYLGGPGAYSPLNMRTTGYSASAWTTWTVDAGTNGISTCVQDLTLTGIPFGMTIFWAFLTFTVGGTNKVTTLARLNCKDVGGIMVVDSVTQYGSVDPSTGTNLLLWVTFSATSVD